MLEGLKLCRECKISLFNENLYLQEGDIAIEPYLSCSYSDVDVYNFDYVKALNYTPKFMCWKNFGDDFFAVWNHPLQGLRKVFEFMKSIDTSDEIKFNMTAGNNHSVLKFVSLGLHIKEHNKSCVDVYAKAANSFTYVFSSTC